jgi:hypothetical protein
MKKLIERIYTVIRYIRALGFSCGIITFIKIKCIRQAGSLKIKGLKKPIKLRLNSSSDKIAFYKIILNKEYDIDLPVHPEYIIDAGANIGLASVFFANKYPEAKIIAIEPDKGNFEILLNNIQGYPQITGLNTALWHYPAWLRMLFTLLP